MTFLQRSEIEEGKRIVKVSDEALNVYRIALCNGLDVKRSIWMLCNVTAFSTFKVL